MSHSTNPLEMRRQLVRTAVDAARERCLADLLTGAVDRGDLLLAEAVLAGSEDFCGLAVALATLVCGERRRAALKHAALNGPGTLT